jgi:iron complex outermembrane receptor protein
MFTATADRLWCRCALLAFVLAGSASVAAEPARTDASADPANVDADDDADDLDLAALLQTDLTVVSATKTAQTLAESPSVITVIRRRDIEERGFRSVAEALASVPGLFINSDFVFHDVGVRGITGDMRGGSKLIKVMIDGRPVAFRNDTTNFIGPEMIPVDAIERIEVIRGPGSALYGANAFLGVVNVVTRSGADVDGARVSGGLLLWNGPDSTQLGGDGSVVVGTRAGPVDVMLAFSQAQIDRSGLALPCGTVFPEAPDPCAKQTTEAQDPTIFDRKTIGDLSRPRSLVASVDVDVAEIVGEDPRRFGVFSLLASYQEIDSVSSFADWAVLQQNDAVDAEGNPVSPIEASVNRIGLRNTSLLLKYELPLFEDLINIGLNFGLSEGGVTPTDRLRDGSFTDPNGAPKERQQYGYRAVDSSVEVRATVLEQLLPFGDGSVIDDVTLIGIGDASADYVTYDENAFATPVTYTTSELNNVGYLGQVTASLFGRRLGLVGGVRQDHHRGALLSDVQLADLAAADRETLCEGRVCYDSFNYRGGVTLSILRRFGPAIFSGSLIDDLYVKVLHGTAFKAPDPSFLYHDDYFGNLPVRHNAALRPQNVTSTEVVIGAQGVGKTITPQVVLFQNKLTDQVTFERTQGGIQAQNTVAVDTVGVEVDVAADFEIIHGAVSASWQDSTRLFEDAFSEQIPDTFAYPDLILAAHVGVQVPVIGAHLVVAGRMVGDRVGHPLNGRGDNIASSYVLPGYVVGDVDLRSPPVFVLGAAHPSVFSVSIRNMFDVSYATSGFQPFYGTDLPGSPRTFLVRLEQTL